MASSVQSGCSARKAAAFSCRAERYSRSAALNFWAGDIACSTCCASVFIMTTDCLREFTDQYKAVSLLTERGYFGSSRRALVEKGFEAGVTGAAHRQTRAIAENRQPAVLAVRLDARDAFQVHDVGAVDAHEPVRVKASFQAGDGLLLKMLFPLTGQCYVIVLGLGVVKLGNGNQGDLRAVFHDKAFQELVRWPGRGGEFVRGRHFLAQAAFRSFQRRVKALAADGFQ